MVHISAKFASKFHPLVASQRLLQVRSRQETGMARSNQGLKKSKLGERTEVRTFAQKADSATAFSLPSKWSLKPQKPQEPRSPHNPYIHETQPTQYMQANRTHRVLLRRWLAGVLYLNIELVLLVILENFTMGFGFAGCEEGFNQVIPNQLPCYLRAPNPPYSSISFRGSLRYHRRLLIGIPQSRTQLNFILWCQWHNTSVTFPTGQSQLGLENFQL